MNHRNHDIHLGTGAYALHALAEPERAAFEKHLHSCEPCTVEVRGLTAAAARLAETAPPVQPSPELRERVMRAVRTVRQDRSSGFGAGWAGRWHRQVPRLALAACLALTATSAGLALWQHDQTRSAREQTRQARAEEQSQADRQSALLQLLTAPDARTATARQEAATATVVYSRARNQAAIITAGLPQPPTGHVYQLWYAQADHMVAAGLLTDNAPEASAPGASATLLSGDANSATAIGVTVEPAGGSPRPTTEPITVIPLPV